MRVAFGSSSFSTSTRLAANSSAMKVMPVMSRPGLRRLSANPASTGSPLNANTTGMRARTLFVKTVDGPRDTSTSMRSAASSSTSRGRRVKSPSA